MKKRNLTMKQVWLASTAIMLLLATSVLVIAQKTVETARFVRPEGIATNPVPQEGPAPDFSAVEKHYEVVKYEYDWNTNIPRFKVVVKPKTDNPPKWWIVKWLDADGVSINNGSMLISPPNEWTAGDPILADCYSPWKRQMSKVKKIVMIQNPNK